MTTPPAIIDRMVDRFLWKLPKTFQPDAGISFVPSKTHPETGWPIGTNLFTAVEAKAMLEHVAGPELAALQAKIDRLMLEFCPDEMTEEQKANWSAHQQPAGPEAAAEIDRLERELVEAEAELERRQAKIMRLTSPSSSTGPISECPVCSGRGYTLHATKLLAEPSEKTTCSTCLGSGRLMPAGRSASGDEVRASLKYLHESTAPDGQWADQAVHGFVGAMLKTLPANRSTGVPRDPSDSYNVMADAVCEIADAARKAFMDAGFDPGEWDGDNIVEDVKRGLVDAIAVLAGRRDNVLEEAAIVCEEWPSSMLTIERVTCLDLAAAIRRLKGIATPSASVAPLSDAERACIDIFRDFAEDEIRQETASVRGAWEVGGKVADRRSAT